jgi:hypothetical protein
MDKLKINFVIDALMFLCLMAIAGLGLLMKYILPPGREVVLRYGRNVDLTWLGWDRHDWGVVHLYLAFGLLTILVIHLILHWSMIVSLFARLLPDPRRRHRVALVFLVVSLLLIYFPFLITPEEVERGRGRGGGRQRSEVGIFQSGSGGVAGVTDKGCAGCPEVSCQEAGPAGRRLEGRRRFREVFSFEFRG